MLDTLQVSTDWSELDAGIFAAICIISLVIFIVWIYVCIWVYRDAEKRGGNGALWAILVFLFGIIPLIIWFLIRGPIRQPGYGTYGYATPPPTPVYQYCPTCGQPMTYVAQYGRWYCNYCRQYK